jgi:hypothetical protein
LFNINQIIARFQQTNEKAFYLAFLRVAVSCWFLFQLILRWPGLEIFYSSNSFLHFEPNGILSYFPAGAIWLKAHYMWLIYTCLLLLVLNILGIGRNIVSLALFIAYTLLYAVNSRINNGGDSMSMLLLLYLSFANTFSYFTLVKRTPFAEPQEKLYNLLSNLAAYAIVINLTLAYFFAGFFKVFDIYWQDGTALNYFLNDDRLFAFAAKGKYIHFQPLFLYIVNYGTLLLELAFPFLIVQKKYRNFTLLLCFLMHLGIYCFLMVYTMSLIFVLQYGMFYSNEEMLSLAQKIKMRCRKLFSFALK